MRPAWTLLELLLVLAVLAVLFALSITAVNHVRSSADNAACAIKLRQIGLAVHNHESIRGSFPSQTDIHTGSWMFRILPYLDQSSLYRQGISWQDDSWMDTWKAIIPDFLCPADGRESSGGVYWYKLESTGYAMTNYLAVCGTDSSLYWQGIWDGIISPVPARSTDITRGLSNTLLAGERPPGPDTYWGWWAYRHFDNSMWVVVDKSETVYLDSSGFNKLNSPLPPDHEPCPDKSYFGPGSLTDYCAVLHFWSQHGAGANWLMGDGSVRWIGYEAKDILPGMANITGPD